VSYSAYLVHWPLLAFYRYGYGEPTPVVSIILFACILLLSWLNWKYVEERFRHVKLSLSQLTLKQFIIPSLVIVILSTIVIKTDGFGIRSINSAYQSTLKNVTNHAKTTNRYDYICQYWRLEEKHFSDPDCVVGDDKNPNILLWGDSNAAHYIGVLGSIAKERKWSFRNVSHAACPPIFNDVEAYIGIGRYDDCQFSTDLVKSKLQQYQTILSLVKSNHKVIIIGKAPVFNDYDRHCLAISINYPLKNCSNIEQSNKVEIDAINARLLSFSQIIDNVEYVDFNAVLCEDGCSPYKDGSPIYFDPSHIEIQYSWQLGKQIVENNQIPKAFNALISSRE
jgi:putative effector of murein hydrolase LrgA (UPF0299 family)